MISSIALALADYKLIKKYSEQLGIKTVVLKPDSLESVNFVYNLFDIIVGDSDFLKGKSLNRFKEYYEKNRYTALVIYGVNRNSVKIPEFIPENLTYFIDTPVSKTIFKSLIHKINNTIRQQLIIDENLGTNRNRENITLTGEVEAIKQINEFINFLAKTPNAICLLRCENGTEKNIIIQMIHQKGKTSNIPLDPTDLNSLLVCVHPQQRHPG